MAAWPGSRAVGLAGDWQAVPVDEALWDAMAGKAPAGAVRNAAFDSAPPGLGDALSRATREGEALAYVETEYFGGTGSQSAGAWVDGEMREAETSRGIGAINSALRVIGVEAAGGKDAFDTLGLGERRSIDDYAPEGPVRLRGGLPGKTIEAPDAARRGLPVWVVVAVFLAAVAFGVGLALI